MAALLLLALPLQMLAQTPVIKMTTELTPDESISLFLSFTGEVTITSGGQTETWDEENSDKSVSYILRGQEVTIEGNVTGMICSLNQLTALDVSKNTELTMLYCAQNQLTSLDVSKNVKLEDLICSFNPIKTLDVSQNPELTELECAQTQLTALNVSNNPKLKLLNCTQNNIAVLDLSSNLLLEILNCSRNELDVLNVNSNPALTGLACAQNELTALNLSNQTELRTLDCSYNQITTLDVSQNNDLMGLDCHDNQLTTLALNKNMGFGWLNCSLNKLTTLDISHNMGLMWVYCAQNQLTELNVSNNTELMTLHCFDNKLTALNVSNNSQLKKLFCYSNQIKDEQMTTLVNSLPKRGSAYAKAENRAAEDDPNSSDVYIIDSKANEGNVLSNENLKIAKERGWKMYDNNGGDAIQIEEQTVGIESIAGVGTQFSITNGTINVRSSRRNAIVEMYDLQGSLCAKATTDGNGQARLNVTSLPNGVYVLKIDGKSTKMTLLQ